ncbi:hypothetical protein K9L67_05490 [Candidatus Woesearchaeota archaeon]|nr:hypothetical protein [Candidatus Woesearchaeota archaeon]MCF7901652.1 hypothetical protein [Candidatus Woesearchaeota archaeon]MCF8013863.1 hypothetical protein [Candidatus Woesearchaeota archaeon]
MKYAFRDIRRFEHVVGTLLKYEFDFWLHKIGVIKKPKNGMSIPNTEPDVLKRIMEDLGGTFVKLGQLLSLRPDLIPHKYCDAFSGLQDDVKQFSKKEAVDIIEKSTGHKLNHMFSKFPNKPIASASIGQVYKAKLHSENWVAVKVKRPGIENIMESDIDILEFFAHSLKNHMKNSILDPVEVVKELRDYTQKEMNYSFELSNIEKFSAANNSLKIPFVFKEFSSSDVLIMEFIEGVKLNDFLKNKISPKERNDLSKNLHKSYLHQVFETGFFHADPHPGNILIVDEKIHESRIALIDYGIVGKIDDSTRLGLLKMFMGLMNKSVDEVVSSMVQLGIVQENNLSLKKDIRDLLSPYYAVSLKEVDFPKVFLKSLSIARKYGVKIPKDYVLLGKALLTLESVCTSIDKDFNLVTYSNDFVKKFMFEKYNPLSLFKNSKGVLFSLASKIYDLPSKIEKHLAIDEDQSKKLELLNKEVEFLEKKVSLFSEKFFLGLFGVALIVASFIFLSWPPLVQGVSIVSIILVIFGISLFIAAFSLKN